MTENIPLFDAPSFTDFEQATAEQIAMAMGRKRPAKSDYEMAVKRTREWNEKRRGLGLGEW